MQRYGQARQSAGAMISRRNGRPEKKWDLPYLRRFLELKFDQNVLFKDIPHRLREDGFVVS